VGEMARAAASLALRVRNAWSQLSGFDKVVWSSGLVGAVLLLAAHAP
jgi:hypothetical protein